MELRPYQKRIANWLCQHPHACLSVGMGLGKTAAVLHFLDYTRQLYPHATALERLLKEQPEQPSTVDYTQDKEMELPY